MNPVPQNNPINRFIALDIHKHYVMVGGQNRPREWTLRPRRVPMARFRAWAEENLSGGDAVVLETTGSVWDLYDIVAPLAGNTVVANAQQVRQIAEARVKTDKEDIQRLITLLLADIVPAVWVPPQYVRELGADRVPLAADEADHDVQKPSAECVAALQSAASSRGVAGRQEP